MLQMEIIKSLQMAAKHETAILNLRILYEASIMNRKDTFVTLDEMKQRIIMTRPMLRQIGDGPAQRSSIATLPSSPSSAFDAYNAVPEGYVPSAVTLGSQEDSKETRSGLARYFQMKRNSSTSSRSLSASAGSPTEKPDINYSAALEELVKARGEDRATMMKDIDEIMVSYKGLDVGGRAQDEPWGQNQHLKPYERHDTWKILHGDGSPRQDAFAQSWTVSGPTIDHIRQPSIASTDSSGSGTFGIIPRPPGADITSTIQSPPPGQERMMGGRPCKDNNYWGFCKGAWDVREDVKKGLALRNMPSGMYNTKEVWECKQCNFRGNTYVVTYPGKKKKETVVDPNIHTSKSGIRYRWIFLAKSHTKKKTSDAASDECNYGCVICSVELKVSSIFGNVDTLMYHLLEHVSGMTQTTMKQTRCIVGRTAGADEAWDINMPLFADVSEME
ncbi:hypothetical protein EJ07DRAFT_137555 [Lizonia empirigonia]|nr:hypothetical protein EJ07DRAFT_137555 [Lizonia empirigonia]